MNSAAVAALAGHKAHLTGSINFASRALQEYEAEARGLRKQIARHEAEIAEIDAAITQLGGEVVDQKEKVG